MRHLFFSLAVAALVAAIPFTGSAKDKEGDHGRPPPGPSHGERGHRRSVPEFDPATVGAIAALVAGGGVLIARRRKS